MKLTCQREALLTACQLAGVAVATRDIKPILKNLKAIAEGDRLTLMATDLELGIRLDLLGIEIHEPGEAILPAGKVLSILRESADETLVITTDEKRCLVEGLRSEYEMPGEDPADFPDLPTFAEGKYHEVTARVLRSLIRKTVFAAARESTKYAMTGVLWEFDGKKVRLVATDSKRMAMAEGPATDVGGADTKGQSHLVPTKAMTLLERSLTDDDEKVQVSLRPNEVLFRTEKAVVYSRLVEGRYPPYREIIPKKHTVRVPLPADALLDAVRQARIMTDDETKKVVFHFAPEKLTLEAQGATTGRSKVEMPLAGYDGAPLVINFDPDYLIEMLRVLGEDEQQVELDLIDGSRPALFRVGAEYLYLVMPLS